MSIAASKNSQTTMSCPDPATRLFQEAATFAARKHQGQTRKDQKTPYVAHPFRVAMIVRQVFDCDDPVAIAGALLHDVIEDTPCDYEAVAQRFGNEVADVVAAMTKDDRIPEPRREDGYYDRLEAGPWQGRLLKLADTYDNICDAPTDAHRERAARRARRAIEIAGDDPRLARAVEQMRRLLGE